MAYGVGLEVSVLAFYYDDPSSNTSTPSLPRMFYFKSSETNQHRQKEVEEWGFAAH